MKIKQYAQSTLIKLYKLLSIDPLTRSYIHPSKDLIELGSAYGGWIIPKDLLNDQSICYLGGVGEDISFDIQLLENYHCTAYAFDPTPKAMQHIQPFIEKYNNYFFMPVGLWNHNTTQKFYQPKNQSHVSHSILNLQNTSEYFEAECRTVKSIMRTLEHPKIDLLKIDIEGAEYRVLSSVLANKLDISCICVEFHLIPEQPDQPRKITKALIKAGYKLIHVKDKFNFTFIQK